MTVLGKLVRLGGPCGICCMGCVGLTATSAVGGATLELLLVWYVLVSGVAYAGRLPIHVIWGHYLCLRPSKAPFPEDRRRLNLLVGLNFVSVITWLGMGVLFLTHPDIGIAIKCAATIALYGLVVVLGLMTVKYTSKVGLKRGTEIVCGSPVGDVFKDLLPRAPEDSLIGRFLRLFTNTSAKHQISSFALVAAAALIAMPAGAYSAETVGKTLQKNLSPKEAPREPGLSPAVAVAREMPAAQAPDPAQAPSPEPAARSLSYSDVCAGDPSPGSPAPSPQRELLRGLWLGGTGMSGAGAVAAGCAQPAEPVPGHPQVWVARGVCGASLRSLGIVAPEYLPALTYQEAAEFAYEKVKEGKLLGASSRWPVGDGDAYIVDTEDGSYVLIRRHTSLGDARPGGSLPCEGAAPLSAPYTIVPPGLVGLWLEIAQGGWVWPAPADPAEPRGSDFVFRPGGPEASPVARAHCISETSCTAWFEGTLLSTSGSLFTSISAIESVVGG